MTRWKAAGPAPRGVDEALWKRFRGAQDTFFAAKQATMTQQDSEFRANAEAKEKLLVEAEALLPIRDIGAARAAYRDILTRWSAIGKVPRDSIRPFDSRLRAVETALSERRVGALATHEPRGPGPRGGHRRQAGSPDRRPRAAGGQSRSPG